jgi:hypothetical protein
MKQRTGLILIVIALFAAMVPAAALAQTSRLPGDDTTVVSPPVPVKPFHTVGWKYYCPAAEPYLSGYWDADGHFIPDVTVLSDGDVGTNVWSVDPEAGTMVINYSNWALHTENGQVSFVCTTTSPDNQ